MRSYRRARVRSIEQIIKRFAPPSENNTEAYIDFVCAQTGYNRKFVPIAVEEVANILVAMMFMEMGISKKEREVSWKALPPAVTTLIYKFDIKFVK